MLWSEVVQSGRIWPLRMQYFAAFGRVLAVVLVVCYGSISGLEGEWRLLMC